MAWCGTVSTWLSFLHEVPQIFGIIVCIIHLILSSLVAPESGWRCLGLAQLAGVSEAILPGIRHVIDKPVLLVITQLL